MEERRDRRGEIKKGVDKREKSGEEGMRTRGKEGRRVGREGVEGRKER